MGKNLFKQSGFTLVEILVYVAIFAISATFLVAILGVVLKIQNRQSSVNEVNQQISFVNATVQRLVQTSSLVENATGTVSNSLTLRMASPALDPTKIYLSNDVVFLQQGNSSPVSLTNANVSVDVFSVTKHENPGGPAVVQIDLSLSYNSSNPQAQVTRTARTAVTRISAATFDSSVVPNSNGAWDVGTQSNKWKDGYFSGNVTVDGKAGIGTSPSGSAIIKSSGDIGFSASGIGLILKAPGGTCYRLGINNGGSFATSVATCP